MLLAVSMVKFFYLFYFFLFYFFFVEAICSELSDKQLMIYRLAVEKKPKSGPSKEVMDLCEITAKHIVEKVKKIIQ